MKVKEKDLVIGNIYSGGDEDRMYFVWVHNGICFFYPISNCEDYELEIDGTISFGEYNEEFEWYEEVE